MFQDYMFFGDEGAQKFSFRLLHMSHIANYVQSLHDLSLNRTLILSDALVGGLLYSSVLDEGEIINLRIHCGSDFTVGVEATYKGEIRGYIECVEDSDVVKEIENGTDQKYDLQVRSLRTQKNTTALSQSTTSSINTTISEALYDHLIKSFHPQSRIKISTWFDNNLKKIRAYGLMLQNNSSQDVGGIKNVEEIIKNLGDLKSFVLENEDPDFLVKKFVPSEFRGIKSINPHFVCECSNEKVERVLSTLPKEELLDIIDKEEDVNIKCHYCSKNHVVKNDRVREIYTSILPQAYGKH